MDSEFDNYADDYNDVLNRCVKISGEEAGFFAEVKTMIMRDHLRKLRPRVGRLLDFGCGTGNSCQYIGKHLPETAYYGVDISGGSIAQAKRRWGNTGFCRFDGSRLPFRDRSFDAAYASVVFHHIPADHHRIILEEIYRILMPGGIFFMFEHNPYNPVVLGIVNNCPFDKDARLLKPGYSRGLFNKSSFERHIRRYYLFFPKMLKLLRWFERYLAFVPLGAQYYIMAQKCPER